MNKTILTLALLAMFGGCSKENQEDQTHAGGGGSVTLWTEKTEFFMEYPGLVVGSEARFTVHLTWLSDFKPVTTGRLALTFRSSDGTELGTHVDGPTSPGIFRPLVKFAKSGKYTLVMIVSDKMKDTLHVGGISVFDSHENIPPEGSTRESDQLITFLKEQQWKTDFRTERVQRRMFGSSVRATGVILSKKNLDVIVSAPFAGVMQPEHNSGAPAVGSTVRGGQTMAVLTPAAQTSDGTDNFAKQYVEAKTRKSLAEAEYQRARQLFEKQSISQREFDEAEAEFKQAEADFATIAKYVQQDTEQPQRADEFNFLLKAPISGTITEAPFMLGKQFDAGEPLFRIVNSSTVWL
ncbi:MAG: efflux RND transporter periplasmic adaptor subunit, partial [Bacteroidota bacterium]